MLMIRLYLVVGNKCNNLDTVEKELKSIKNLVNFNKLSLSVSMATFIIFGNSTTSLLVSLKYIMLKVIRCLDNK